MNTHRNCPVCNSNNYTSCYKGYNLEFVKCKKCNMLYQNNPELELDKESQGEQLEEYKHYMNVHKIKYNANLKLLHNLMNVSGLKTGNILEIGGGTGSMGVVAMENGWDYYAIEPSKHFYEFQKANNPDNMNIFNCFPLEAPLEDNYFDLIVLDNVLEHVSNVKEVIKYCYEKLKQNGYLYIEVPNEKYFKPKSFLLDKLRGFKKPPTFPGHINLFIKSSMKKLLQDFNFTYVKVTYKQLCYENDLKFFFPNSEIPKSVMLIGYVLKISKIDKVLGVSYWLKAILKK
jgi:SAM-dependent methyltransferase